MKCQSEARIISHEDEMQLDIQVLERHGEIISFDLIFEGKKRVAFDSMYTSP